MRRCSARTVARNRGAKHMRRQKGNLRAWPSERTMRPNVMVELVFALTVVSGTSARIVGGKGVCDHGRARYMCKDCGGKGICCHNRQKSLCRECIEAKGVYEHLRQRAKCKVCSPCPHGLVKYVCKVCNPGSFCKHGRYKYTCRECGGSSVCAHNRRKRTCKECYAAGTGGKGICMHNCIKYDCKTCQRLRAWSDRTRMRKMQHLRPWVYNVYMQKMLRGGRIPFR